MAYSRRGIQDYGIVVYLHVSFGRYRDGGRHRIKQRKVRFTDDDIIAARTLLGHNTFPTGPGRMGLSFELCHLYHIGSNNSGLAT